MVRRETERLILTSPGPEHEAELFQLHNDRLVQEFVFDNVPQTTQDVRQWLDWFLVQWRKNGFGDWMVYEKTIANPIFIGRCGLRDYQGTNDLEIATSFSERGRGRGLALEAMRFTVTHALRNSIADNVVGLVKHGNTRSERAAKKLGLCYVHDCWRYGKFWQYYKMTREAYCSAAEQIA
ncbi:RimJ/RimL family protein N-acetyltransferase [Bradyrhizobium sp. USDA 4448]